MLATETEAVPDRNVRILLVEDDDVDREKIRRFLGQYSRPHSLSEAISLGEASTEIRRSGYDCIILDFRLGDGSGTDLIPFIQEVLGRECPIIMVTGMGSETSAVEAMREGVFDYLPKAGLDRRKLHQALDNSLRWSEMQRQLTAAEQRLRRQSLYDGLTGLPNRNLFFDRLEHACAAFARDRAGFAVLMMDLNRFKEVNDTLGHAAGDEVLREVARRLSPLLRQSDTLARLGGDEFAAILPGAGNAEIASHLAGRLSAALHVPMTVAGKRLVVGMSVGVAFCPNHGTDANQLMSRADRAMYQSKRRMLSVVIDAGSDEAPAPSSQVVIGQIEQAMLRRELVLHYQPKVDLVSGEVVGLEALVRWNRGPGDVVRPADFLPAVEQSRLLDFFTYHTLELALRQAREWLDAGNGTPVAVNLSARMLERETLERDVLDLFERYAVPHGLVSFEITETALLVNVPAAREAVRRLGEHGIAFSIDDFGAGYASFSYLRDFRVREIKMDRTFISSISAGSFDAVLLRSVAVLCAALGIRVVAEGIEDLACRDVLAAEGCRYGQGYAIARPMPAGDLPAWSARWKAEFRSANRDS
ncbi:MAG: EAL domain-containing protein [Rhodospirillales bacterium]|nr:EAL domain-containing protein [Rhodospirillales bacterium]